MFGIILISASTIMHLFVFWRAASVPVIKKHISRITLIGAGITLWTIFFLGRVIGHSGTGLPATILEFIGMNWMAALFLIFVSLLFIDILTCFGLLLPKLSPKLRGLALSIGILLSMIALVQGLRPPVIEKYEVCLPKLPEALDGKTIAIMSDLHLGSQLGEDWLAARIAQVKALHPDLVVMVGDIFEGHGADEMQLIDELRQLYAPLGIWAVTGNHEYYGENQLYLFEKSRFNLLANEWAEVAPGLVLAGVNDLTIQHFRNQGGDPVSQALLGIPKESATIFLSHTPWEVEKAAEAGVGLMLSGHTHGGQVWPFDYLVQSWYPYREGRFNINNMTLIVSRGTGTWGSRMRLWYPSVIIQVTLRKSGK